jgi:hypothetical protein
VLSAPAESLCCHARVAHTDIIAIAHTFGKRNSAVVVRLTDAEAVRDVEILQADRKRADYGYGAVPEPYDVMIVNERLAWANQLIEDLRTLL